jgi:flagellar M-ring protein FliF
MAQIKKIFGNLEPRQIAIIAVVLLLCAGGLYSLVHWRKEADFKTLYTGLAAEDSAAVIQKLKESGTEYRLSDTGDVISVPSTRLAELRLQLAAAGLPRTGRIGYEIFDKTNLGATEFVEHVNYGRALEGELERSVGALSEVEQARVHITFPKESVFVESRQPAKASVMMKLKPGAHLSPRNVMAVAHLVSSAVEGLTPDGVSILDMQGNLLSQPHPSSPEDAASDSALDYRQKVERDLMQKIAFTLDPLLGHDRYRASMSVDLDLTSGEQSEETVDPAKSVMLQSQKTEEMIGGAGSGGAGSGGGIPGTASNLPRPAQRAGSSSVTTTRRTENITWQPSRVTRTTKLPQGALKRMSVALVLDQEVKWEGTGKNVHKVIVPPSAEELKSVKDVVTAAIGFVPERGDLITVETLPFSETLNQQQPEASMPIKPVPASEDLWKSVTKLPMPVLIGVAAVVLVLLSAVIFLLVRKGGKKDKRMEMMEEHKAIAGSAAAHALEASDAEAQIEAQMAEREEEQRKADLASLASIKVPPVKTKKAEVLAKQIRESTKKDSAGSAQLLQSWIHDR